MWYGTGAGIVTVPASYRQSESGSGVSVVRSYTCQYLRDSGRSSISNCPAKNSFISRIASGPPPIAGTGEVIRNVSWSLSRFAAAHSLWSRIMQIVA